MGTSGNIVSGGSRRQREPTIGRRPGQPTALAAISSVTTSSVRRLPQPRWVFTFDLLDCIVLLFDYEG